MAVPRMHPDEVAVPDVLVRRLLEDQVPDLAGLPLTRVAALGTDHAVFRLGDGLAVRLPRIGWAAHQGPAAARWLPHLAPHLPVRIPVPLTVGEPGRGFPHHWTVVPWLAGERPQPGGPDQARLADSLAAVVAALHRIDHAGAPTPAPGRRGGPLGAADGLTRAAAAALRIADDPADLLGRPEADAAVDRLLALWDDGVAAPPWAGPPVWTHGDLADGNVLVTDGRLTGVIDWGTPTVGDPAVDLMGAWALFDADGRRAFRAALDALAPGALDDGAWRRGRAWAVSAALQALPYYRHTNPDIVARSRRVVAQVLADGDDLPGTRPALAPLSRRPEAPSLDP